MTRQILYEHPNGAVIGFDKSESVIELRDPDDRERLSIAIGPVGLLELAARCAQLGAELLQGGAA